MGGGIGVGLAGGLGMGIAVFVLGLAPGKIPVSVILIIFSVILTLSVMQRAGGMRYMVKVAEELLRNHPKRINLLAPATTAAMYVVVEGMGVSFGSAMAVIFPAALVGTIVTAFVASKQGCDLKDDPIYQNRLEKGLVNFTLEKEKETESSPEAKRSVLIFVGGVTFIVLMLLFKPLIGPTLGSRDISLIMATTCKVPLRDIKKAPIFADGAESIIVIMGIVWLSSTIPVAFEDVRSLAALACRLLTSPNPLGI